MASQQPRPAWFRFPALGNRPAAPAPTPTPNPASPPPPPVAQPVPIRPPTPMPAITRPIIPTIPIMPPVVPTQSQEPALPPSTAVSPRSYQPRSPTTNPRSYQPRSPMVTAAPETAPGRSPTTNPVQVATAPKSPIKPSETAAPPPSPPAQVQAPLSSPVVPSTFRPTRPSVPATLLAPQTPPAPSPTIAPHATSPVPKAPITASRNALISSSPLPASPKIKTNLLSSSMPTSPVSRPVASPVANSATAGLKAATPVSSPKTVKPLDRTPEQSPKINPLSNPPSPFTLPPTKKIEAATDPKFPADFEQKTVLVQETIVKPKEMTNSRNKHADSSGRRDHVMNTKGTSQKNSDSEEELGMKVITLAGENKGAIMELSPNQRKSYPPGNPQRMDKNKNNYNGSDFDQSSSESGKGKSNKEGKTSRGMEMPTAVFLNSNLQGVNNSILYNCNHRHNDPGVHISLPKKVNGNWQPPEGPSWKNN